MCSGRDAILVPGCGELECGPDFEGGGGVLLHAQQGSRDGGAD
jgi:hypothetical protein